MSAALCALQEAIQRDPKPYKNLIPSFVSILKQVWFVLLPPVIMPLILSAVTMVLWLMMYSCGHAGGRT